MSHMGYVWKLFFAFTFLGFIHLETAAGSGKTHSEIHSPGSILTNDLYRPFLINNFFSNFSNNGDGAYYPPSNGSLGAEFPAGSSKSVIFEEGLLWGAKQGGILKVGGSAYRHGLQAGRVVVSGNPPTAEDPFLSTNRIFRVRPDISPSVAFSQVEVQLDSEALLSGRYQPITAQDIYNQYVQDWTEWPASQGAPFEDKNGNGLYDPSIDIPGVPGADQTLWHVSNDVDSTRTRLLYGSSSVGLEVQRVIWGYKGWGPLANCIFETYRIINKSTTLLDSVFIAQWSDPDIGNSSDDMAGCDTTKSLGYAYNGGTNDATYGSTPPAVGYAIIQGPIVPGLVGDSARFKGAIRRGSRNLRMTSFNFFVNSDPMYGDPIQGLYTGSSQWYNLMHGRVGSTGAQYVNPSTGIPTTFVYSGDPVAGTGWLDATPADIRIALCSGPFQMAPGDTQEVVVALVASGGSDRFANVTALKSSVHAIRSFIYEGKPLLAISAVDSLYPLQASVYVSGSAKVFLGSIANSGWFVAMRPAGSVAQIQNVGPADRIRIDPDLPGTYSLGYTARTPGGASDTIYATFELKNNRAPVPNVSLPSEIFIGDTIAVDGSATVDPDGSPVTYSWTFSGCESGSWELIPQDTVAGILLDGSTLSPRYIPFRTSLVSVYFEVSDGMFTTSLRKWVHVKPRATSNMSLDKNFPPNYFSPTYYFGNYWIREYAGTIWAGLGTIALLDFDYGGMPAISYSTPGYGRFCFGTNNLLFVAGMGAGAYVNTTNGSGLITNTVRLDPDGTSILRPDTTVMDVYYQSPYLIFSDGLPGLYVYNVADPASPQLAAQFANGERWGELNVAGSRMYALHTPTGRISVVDISNPAAMAPLATIALGRTLSRIHVWGSLLFSSIRDTLIIYEVSDPTTPVFLAEVVAPKKLHDFNIIYDFAFDGNRLLLATSEGAYLYDVSNPSHPWPVGHYLTGIPQTSAYLKGSKAVVSVWDRYEGMSDERLGPIARVNIPPSTAVAADGEGLPESFALWQNFPNPFNPATTIQYQLSASGPVSLVVYDILGRRVATIVNSVQPAGKYSVRFDATNIASGFYFYSLHAGSFHEVKRMALVR